MASPNALLRLSLHARQDSASGLHAGESPGRPASLPPPVTTSSGSSTPASGGPNSPVHDNNRARSYTGDRTRLVTLKRSDSSSSSLAVPSSGANKSVASLDEEGRSKPKRFSLRALRRSKMERLILFLQSESSGLEIRDRSRRLTTYLACFPGDELVETLLTSCGFLSRDEAIRYSKALTEDGYLVPVESYRPFSDDSTLFRIQTSYFWPSRNWKPTDFDYAVYLHKRVLRAKKEYQLEVYEHERYEKLKATLGRKWDQVEETAKNQIERSKALNKIERKVLDSQERGFWWVIKPPAEVENTLRDIEEKKRALKGKFETEEMIEYRLSGDDLLTHLNKRLQRLNVSLNTTRVKISVASKSLTQRCEAYQLSDPLLHADSGKNAWHLEEPEKFEDRKTPHSTDVKKWSISLRDLLQDKIGCALFDEFLKSEFSQENLNFYHAVQDIVEEAASHEEYAQRCLHIYKRYIRQNAPMELNITSAVRTSLKKMFEEDNGNLRGIPELRKTLEEGCLDEAHKAVYTLMSKDSYMRFLQSKVVLDLMAS